MRSLSGARVLGDGLRALADGVLGQLIGQQQSDGGLDLATSDRRSLVVVGETGRFAGNTLKEIVHERIHDTHRLARNAGVRVHLLQHFVNVDAITLPPSTPSLLLVPGDARCLRLRHRLLRTL